MVANHSPTGSAHVARERARRSPAGRRPVPQGPPQETVVVSPAAMFSYT